MTFLFVEVTLKRFRRVRKIAIDDLVSSCVCPSFRMQQLGSHLTDFHYIWFLLFFRKPVEKIQVSFKSNKHTGTLREDQYKFFIISRGIFHRMKCLRRKL